ncbi:MAG: NAD-dependent epimerase/dehydratase family protein, partial [Nitrososphaeraceae archaeon]|nr:NAD-dependent epimerase/dehydratase family protein [Nitrososphaeraceae archaeon]
RLLYQRNYEIIVIDNLSNGNKNFLEDSSNSSSSNKFSFYKEDIRNKKNILDIFNHERIIDTCIHLAAKINVNDSITNPEDTIDVNVKGTLNVLEACSSNGVKNFIFASSAAVYGEPKKLPLSEDEDLLEPLSPYGASKVAGEALVSSYRRSKKIKNAISLRFFNVYGDGQNIEYAGVITRFAERLSRGLRPIIYGDGKQTRDFVSVNDVVNAILLAVTEANKIKMSSSSVFNIGTGIPISIDDLAQRMIRIFDINLKPIYCKAKVGDIKYIYADTKKSKCILKFIAIDELESCLKQIVKQSFLQK